jgi:hypothetical protein
MQERREQTVFRDKALIREYPIATTPNRCRSYKRERRTTTTTTPTCSTNYTNKWR